MSARPTIRPARLDELPALARAVAAQKLLTHYEIGAPRLAQLLAEAIGRGEPVLVVDDGGGARGFAWYLYAGTLGVGGYLRLIALVPGSEGHGAGAALLDAVEADVATRARHLFLLVSHWNEGARRFYARRGYAEVGCLPAFVRADTDEIICWKRLP
ncbi:MAG TPA: GNAT family N-acetyltransferase [Polyangia bacterium]